MSALLSTPVGIQSFSSGLVSKVSVSLKLKLKVIPDYSSAFGSASSLDPTGNFSVEGYGEYSDQPAALGVAGSNAPSNVTGGIILIDNLNHAQTSGEFQKWKYSGQWNPAAGS